MAENDDEVSLWVVLGKLWKTAPAGFRRLAKVLWITGALLVGATMVVDHMLVWQQRPFLTNFISNIIGAIFAVPFALLVLSGFSSYQAELSVSRRIDVKVRAAKVGLMGVLVPLQQRAAGRAVEVSTEMNKLWQHEGDADAVSEALQALSAFTDLTELELFEHNIAQVRTHWELVREALTERAGNDGDWYHVGNLQRTSGDFEAVVSAYRRHLERGPRTYPANGRARASAITPAKIEGWQRESQELMISSHRLVEMVNQLAKLCDMETGGAASALNPPAN